MSTLAGLIAFAAGGLCWGLGARCLRDATRHLRRAEEYREAGELWWDASQATYQECVEMLDRPLPGDEWKEGR